MRASNGLDDHIPIVDVGGCWNSGGIRGDCGTFHSSAPMRFFRFRVLFLDSLSWANKGITREKRGGVGRLTGYS